MGALKYCVLLVLLYSIPVKATTTVFHTNCTRPPSGFGFNFVAAPNTRGTLEILWSCLFTLLICTWEVQHLNVPPQDISSVARFWAKPVWMLITLLAPELLVGIALQEFLQARSSVRMMQRELPELVEQGGWTMTHAFYANMYGFMVKRRVSGEPDLASTSVSIHNTMFRPSVIRQRDLLILNTEKMVIYLKSLPAPRPFFTEAEIQSRAKGDMFLKCIAGLQVFWFVVQMCARKARNLPISQLEVAVLAFAVCTLSSYLLWFKKPQDVNVPTFLDEGSGELPISRGFEEWDGVFDRYHTTDSYEDFSLPLGPLNVDLPTMGVVVGGTIFGALHLLAWNMHFPTHVEKIRWRTVSVVATTVPTLVLSLNAIPTEKHKTTVSKMTAALGVVYFWCRVFIVVETFRSLGYLPGGASATTWSTYVPHVM